MPKKDVKPHSGGKVKNDRSRNLQYFLKQMEKEELAKKKVLEGRSNDVIGPRMQIIAAYEANFDINEAFLAMNQLNNKLGRKVYTEDMIRTWIQEYENKDKFHKNEEGTR